MNRSFTESDLDSMHPNWINENMNVRWCECGNAVFTGIDKGFFYIAKSQKRGRVVNVVSNAESGLIVNENYFNQDTSSPCYKIGRSTDLDKRLKHYRKDPATQDIEFAYTWEINHHKSFESHIKRRIKSCVDDHGRGRHTFDDYHDMNWFFKYSDINSHGYGMNEWFQATSERIERFARQIDFMINFTFHAENAKKGYRFLPLYQSRSTKMHFDHTGHDEDGHKMDEEVHS